MTIPMLTHCFRIAGVLGRYRKTNNYVYYKKTYYLLIYLLRGAESFLRS